MRIDAGKIEGRKLEWIVRCPEVKDAVELAELRKKINMETENLDRESGEGVLTNSDFEKIITEDNLDKNSIFIVSEINGQIAGFARCIGFKLTRFRHKAEFGICLKKDYWGNGIGGKMLETVLENIGKTEIRKITLSVLEQNTNAINLYKKFGFVEEGLLINDRKHKDGKYYNTIVMGKILE